MKVGVKVGQRLTEQYLSTVYSHVDFLELYAHPDENFDILSDFDKPVVIHVAHFANGINFANPKKQKINEQALAHAVNLANRFKSEKIVFHPELNENESCSLESLERFIYDNYDPRLLIENMPHSSAGFVHFASAPADIKNIVDNLRIGFCLDITHALEYIQYTNLPKTYIKKYFDLSPRHFHITDTKLSDVFAKNYDERHLSFGDGDLDLEWCKKLLPTNSSITIETPIVASRHIKEVSFLKS